MPSELFGALNISPTVASFGILAVVPVVVWVYSLISWMVMGEMDALLGTCGIIAALLLGFVAIAPPDPLYSPIAFAGLVGMMIVFPFARRQLDRRANVEIEVEQIEKAYKTLAEMPENAAAMFKLADGLYARGLVSQAVAIADQALASMPKNVFPAEHRVVDLWRRHAPAPASPLRCLHCGRTNDPAAVFCESCGAQYLALYARGRWLGRALAWKLVASWAAASVALVGLPVTIQVAKAAVGLSVLVAMQVGVVALLLWRAFFCKEAKGE